MKSTIISFLKGTFQTCRRADGWMLRCCIFSVVIAGLYNFLFINDEIGALSEHSWSEEKAVYGISLFATRLLFAALLGALIGFAVDVYQGSRREAPKKEVAKREASPFSSGTNAHN